MDILIYGKTASDLVKPYKKLINEGLEPVFDDKLTERKFYSYNPGTMRVTLYDIDIRFDYGNDYYTIPMGDYCYTDSYSSISSLVELAHSQGKPYRLINTIDDIIVVILRHIYESYPNDVDLRFRVNLYKIARRNNWSIDIYETVPYHVKFTNPRNGNSSEMFLYKPTDIYFVDLEHELKERLEFNTNTNRGPLFKFLTEGSLQNSTLASIPKTNPSVHFAIEKVIFNDPATIILWEDGSKTVVKVQEGDTFDKEKGLAMALLKKLLGNDGNYYKEIKRWTEDEND